MGIYEIETEVNMFGELTPLIEQVARLTDGERYLVTHLAKKLAKEYELFGLPSDPFHRIRREIASGSCRVANDPYATGVHHKISMGVHKERVTKKTKVAAILTIWEPHKMDDFKSSIKSIWGLRNFWRGGNKSRHKLGFEFPFGELERVFTEISGQLTKRAEELKEQASG